jgi:hypothetical protein
VYTTEDPVRTGKLHCPNCNGVELYHSKSRHFMDIFMMFVGKGPFRCKICNRRFYAKEPAPEPKPEQQRR